MFLPVGNIVSSVYLFTFLFFNYLKRTWGFFQARPLGNEPFGLGMLSVNMYLSELSWIM